MQTRRHWVGEAGIVLGLAALVAAKMWTLITPWSQSRASLGGDFGLAVEPYFYHMLKQGTIPLWDPTLATARSLTALASLDTWGRFPERRLSPPA